MPRDEFGTLRRNHPNWQAVKIRVRGGILRLPAGSGWVSTSGVPASATMRTCRSAMASSCGRWTSEPSFINLLLEFRMLCHVFVNSVELIARSLRRSCGFKSKVGSTPWISGFVLPSLRPLATTSSVGAICTTVLPVFGSPFVLKNRHALIYEVATSRGSSTPRSLISARSTVQGFHGLTDRSDRNQGRHFGIPHCLLYAAHYHVWRMVILVVQKLFVEIIGRKRLNARVNFSVPRWLQQSSLLRRGQVATFNNKRPSLAGCCLGRGGRYIQAF